jgi:hypothetical protein
MNKEKQRETNRLYQYKFRLRNRKKLKEKSKLYFLKNRIKINERRRLRYPRDSKKIKESVRLYRLNNKEKIKNYKKLYRLKNKEKEKKYFLLYVLKNPYFNKNNSAKYRASQLKATPKFADLNKIKEIYKNCPKGYHVDHIVPLQGKEVCGLHVEWNLQYLTPSENSSKSNKLINDYL